MVESLAREIWTEHYTPIIGPDQAAYMLERFQSRDAIGAQIADGVLYFLLQEGNEFIGYLAVQPSVVELFLSKIYILRSRRGKGYGKEAIRFVEALAREKGLSRIGLTVNKNNSQAIRAYEGTGFRKAGALVKQIGAGFVMDDYKMEKKVALLPSNPIFSKPVS